MIDAILDFLLMMVVLVDLFGAMLILVCLVSALAVLFGFLDAVGFEVECKTKRRLRDHDEGPEQ